MYPTRVVLDNNPGEEVAAGARPERSAVILGAMAACVALVTVLACLIRYMDRLHDRLHSVTRN